MTTNTATDRGSWWLCATDAEFTARAHAEQARMQEGRQTAYASHYDATASKVRDSWRNPMPAVKDES